MKCIREYDEMWLPNKPIDVNDLEARSMRFTKSGVAQEMPRSRLGNAHETDMPQPKSARLRNHEDQGSILGKILHAHVYQ